MTSSSARFNKLASNFANSEVHRSSPSITRLHELLGDADGLAVCDIACAAGHLAMSFAGGAGRIVGVDPAPQMLETFRQSAADAGITIETHESFAEQLPFANDEFDVVVSRLAPHHFRDIQQSVNEMARIVRPGGRVAVIDLEGEQNAQCDDLLHRLELLHDPTHVRSYRADQWWSFLETAGLQIVTQESKLSERPGGVKIARWCEIASSGDEAEAEIREVLAAAAPEDLDVLGITYSDGEWYYPVRTVLTLGQKPA